MLMSRFLLFLITEGEGVGRHSSRDLSPEADDRREPLDRKVVIPTPPPLQGKFESFILVL